LTAELSNLISHSPAGQQLPSEPELAKQLGVSRATLREAMRSFETQGLIRRRQGAGTFVVGQVPVMESGLEVLESVDAMARRMNLSITVSDLRVERMVADQELVNALDVPLGARMTRISRVMQTDGRPVAYLVDTLPEAVLRAEDLPASFTGSVLDFLQGRANPPTGSRAAVSAIGATADVAKALEIQRGDVLLHFSSQLFNAEGVFVDYSKTYFIPGYFNFHIVRRVAGGS
jgi:GntR family transcriptional regulator